MGAALAVLADRRPPKGGRPIGGAPCSPDEYGGRLRVICNPPALSTHCFGCCSANTIVSATEPAAMGGWSLGDDEVIEWNRCCSVAGNLHCGMRSRIAGPLLPAHFPQAFSPMRPSGPPCPH